MILVYVLHEKRKLSPKKKHLCCSPYPYIYTNINMMLIRKLQDDFCDQPGGDGHATNAQHNPAQLLALAVQLDREWSLHLNFNHGACIVTQKPWMFL